VLGDAGNSTVGAVDTGNNTVSARLDEEVVALSSLK